MSLGKIFIEPEPCSGGYTATWVFCNDEGIERSFPKHNLWGSPIFTRWQINSMKPLWENQGYNVIEEKQ